MSGPQTIDYGYRADHVDRGELVHHYGSDVHILADAYHLSLLARLSSDKTFQPEINHLVTTLYRDLVARVIANELRTIEVSTPTRMIAHTPLGVYVGRVVDPRQKVVCVDIARAGMLPASVCFDALNHVLDPIGVRQDHLVMNRVVDAHGQVVGARIFGEKAGGEAGGQTMLFPDPMGATGSSVLKAVGYYASLGDAPGKVVTMNLIVTPEFIRNVKRALPDAVIYAFRLDRGLSEPDVLDSVPGTWPERERGLNDHQYIVPGAGGLGEVINNVFV